MNLLLAKDLRAPMLGEVRCIKSYLYKKHREELKEMVNLVER